MDLKKKEKTVKIIGNAEIDLARLEENIKSFESLESKIKEEPITRENFLSFLRNEVESVTNDLPEKGALLVKHMDKYRIYIGFLYDRSEQEISLVHEIYHALYDSLDWKKEIENKIETEAKRFYDENKDFVRNIYSKLADSGIDPKSL